MARLLNPALSHRPLRARPLRRFALRFTGERTFAPPPRSGKGGRPRRPRPASGLSGAVALLMVCTTFAAAPANAANPAAGKGVFVSQCSTCHSDARSRPVVIGPPLFGVVGRKAGTVPGFAYSSTMRSAGFTWTPDRLKAYLPAPSQYLPGVKMTYPGLKNPTQLEDLVAYLNTLH
jgi:cytochrome c